MISSSSARAIRHPASGYVQGINDLVTPFFVVFLSEYLEGSIDNWTMSDLSSDKISNVEADCYWCLSKLLDGMQDHYTFAQPGIQRLVFKLKELVRRIDGNLFLTQAYCFFFKYELNYPIFASGWRFGSAFVLPNRLIFCLLLRHDYTIYITICICPYTI